MEKQIDKTNKKVVNIKVNIREDKVEKNKTETRSRRRPRHAKERSNNNSELVKIKLKGGRKIVKIRID